MGNALRMYALAGIVMLGAVSCFKPEVVPVISEFDYISPSSLNLDPDKLIDLDKKITDNEYGEIHSFIVIKQGKIAYENYYNGYTRDNLHPLNDATAAITSLIVARCDNEYSDDLYRMPIIDIFEDKYDFFYDIPQKDKITVRHILRHESGISWNEWYVRDNQINDLNTMRNSDNWLEYVLSKPMIFEPGFKFNYNSGHGVLLAESIKRITARPIDAYSKDAVFKPINVEKVTWNRTPDNEPDPSWGLNMRPIDMGKVGQLMLNEGITAPGDTIISKRWINRLTSRSTRLGYFNIGMNWFSLHDFHTLSQHFYNDEVYFLWGAGGQFVMVFPRNEMVVVSTAANYGAEINEEEIFFKMIINHLNTELIIP